MTAHLDDHDNETPAATVRNNHGFRPNEYQHGRDLEDRVTFSITGSEFPIPLPRSWLRKCSNSQFTAFDFDCKIVEAYKPTCGTSPGRASCHRIDNDTIRVVATRYITVTDTNSERCNTNRRDDKTTSAGPSWTKTIWYHESKRYGRTNDIVTIRDVINEPYTHNENEKQRQRNTKQNEPVRVRTKNFSFTFYRVRNEREWRNIKTK